MESLSLGNEFCLWIGLVLIFGFGLKEEVEGFVDAVGLIRTGDFFG